MDKFFVTPFAQSGDRSAIPDAADPSGFVSYAEGYGDDYERPNTDPQAKNIERQKMNSLLFQITTAIREQQSQGFPDFITSALNGGVPFSYAARAIVRYAGDNYVSLVGSNTTTPADTTKWALFGSATSLPNEVDISNFADLKEAIAALALAGPNGGVVNVPIGAWPVGDWSVTDYMDTPNIKIRGVKLPNYSDNADRLEMGSVLYGRFYAFANFFEHENVGWDLGKHVVDTYFGGLDTHSANFPVLGGTWDAFGHIQPDQTAPLPARRGYRSHNVRALSRDSLSFGHSMLVEAIDGGRITGVCEAMYAIHGIVLKSLNITFDSLVAYSNSSDNVIIKSDGYATGGHIQGSLVDGRRYPPASITPWSTPAQGTYSLFINPETANMGGPIQIACVKGFGQSKTVWLEGADTAKQAFDVQIGTVISDGFSGTTDRAVGCGVGDFRRCQIGQLIANTVGRAVHWTHALTTENQLQIGQVQAQNVTDSVVRAESFAVVKIGKLDVRNAVVAYYIEDTARVLVGEESLALITTAKWGRSAPALTSGWINFGSGNEAFDVVMCDYGIALRGLVKAQATLTNVVANLPPYLTPLTNERSPAFYRNSSASVNGSITITSGGAVVCLDGASTPAVGDYTSLRGVRSVPGA